MQNVEPPQQRTLHEPGSVVKLLELNGSVSTTLYRVVAKPDRNGRVAVESTTPPIKSLVVNKRRLLPPEMAAVVLENGDKYQAHCPVCGVPSGVSVDAVQFTCSEHGIFEIYWLGVRPMAEKAKPDKQKKVKATKPAKAPKERPAAAKQQRVKFNPDTIAHLGELWVKRHINFDHPNIDVCAFTLIVQDDAGVRKFCLNTYDGLLGKKTKPLDVSQPGYKVKDVEKQRQALAADGYELYERTTETVVDEDKPADADFRDETTGEAVTKTDEGEGAVEVEVEDTIGV